MEYINIVISCALGGYLLVSGLWALGFAVLPADGRLQLERGPAYIAALVNALLAILLGAVGFTLGRTPVESGLYVVGAAGVVVFALRSVRRGDFVLFDLYPRDRRKGQVLILVGSLFLVLNVIRLVLGIIIAMQA